MKILYIDTSSSYLYTGIVSNDNLLIEVKKDFGKDLSKYSINEVKLMFEKTGISPNEIDKIIVVSGPGSFTGIRIGMTFAKIFAWSMNKEIITISSLKAMVNSLDSSAILVPIIDARRGYVFAGVYKDDKNILKDQYIKLDELIKKIENFNEKHYFVTNNAKFNFPNILKYNPNILNIVKANKDNVSINPHLVNPTYLKLTEAEENLGNM